MLTIINNKSDLANQTGEICAAGTDVYARRRLGISEGNVLDISRLKNLDKIKWQADGSVRIGPLVKIKTLAEDPKIKATYPALAKAAGGLATPQIRAMATIGGNLLQKNRCWYYRNTAFDCYKKGGDSCPARTGNHQYGVAFDRSPCVAVHPSTLGMTLIAYDAKIEVDGNAAWTMTDLYGDGSNPRVDNLLPAHRLLTNIVLEAPVQKEQGGYSRAISRFEAEWAMVEVSVRLVVENNSIQFAKVAMGAVANVPLNLPSVNEFLVGKTATEDTFKEAAIIATRGVNPLPMTTYKVKLIYGTVLDALLKTVEE